MYFFQRKIQTSEGLKAKTYKSNQILQSRFFFLKQRCQERGILIIIGRSILGAITLKSNLVTLIKLLNVLIF